jgi:hypothetical protein
MKQETMSRDLANRSRDIHWPEGFSPDQADLFSHNELRIEASCERVSVGTDPSRTSCHVR